MNHVPEKLHLGL